MGQIVSKVATKIYSPFKSAKKAAMPVISHSLPTDVGDSLREMVGIIHKLFLGDLNFIDINIALSILAILQAKRTDNTLDIRQYVPAEDSTMAKNFAHYLKYATAAYGKTPLIDPDSMSYSSDREWIKAHLGLPSDKIYPYVDTNAVKGHHMLEHYVAVDDAKKSVVLALMGTLTLAGALKDVRCEYLNVDVWGGKHDVHGGMWKSAQELVKFPSLLSQVKQELEANPDYKLVVVGHSLGGAVASLVSTLLAATTIDGRYITNDITVPGRPIVCYGFEPAPGFDTGLATKTKPFMYSIVNKNDIVPSLSYGALLDFKAIARLLKKKKSCLKSIINGLVTNTLDADKHLKYFRSLATNKKLVPPGRLWALKVNDLGKMEIGEVMNVGERFGEARFLQGMITHHFPLDIVKSLEALQDIG